MPTTSPILLIIGAGTNVGQHVAKAFIAKGYKVASVSRKANPSSSTDSEINIQADMADPSSVEGVFAKVKSLLGVPSVVVYNAAAVTFNDKKNPLTVSLEDFKRTLSVNTTSVFAAAQQAVLGFAQLPETASKTFIFTGNICNELVIAQLVDQGAGKAATANLINSWALAYQDRGYKFYYADERNADGSPAYAKIDGEAHGVFYSALAEHETQGPWQQTFVKGMGYKEFERSEAKVVKL